MDQIPLYFVILSSVYTFLLLFVYWRAPQFQRDRRMAMDLCFVLMISGFIGGRLLHVFYESPQIYIYQPSLIFKFWQGGFVFYGGLLSSWIASFLFLRSRQQSFLDWANFMAPIFALGYSLGRWSCFFSGCCYGRFCELPWSVKFAWDQSQIPRHPTQIYASLWEMMVFIFLIFWERRGLQKQISPPLFAVWLILHGIGRIVMETFRDDFRGHFIAGFSLSTWLSFLLILTGLLLFRKGSSRHHETDPATS